MIVLPTSEEITRIMFKLNPNKAPGPDGLSSGFFKAAWGILGEEVVGSIHQFFHSSFLPATANSTILTLVPKFPGASCIVDYRPIACLNTLYKVISRLLVSRLKPILQGLIVPNQTAFVKDRLLVENTVLASELVNGYHKNKAPKRITLKVDIAKAFDTLSWDFLFSCLDALQLPPRFTSWLKACICTTSFTVGYNGTVNGYFKGKRGLRQGDPLSPYLFVIAMNSLSLMLNKVAEEGKLSYHQNCHQTKLTHLSFADDLLIFIDGSIESVQTVLKTLHEFEQRSGLAVSFQKTSFFASGLSEEEIATIQASTGMSCASLPMRYLGVPLSSKKLSLHSCQPLIQQVKAKFSSWTVKTLSFAGRLLLIKTVISGITTFWCSSFILPMACVKVINSMCGAFLWTGGIEGNHSARVSWDKVTNTKEQGGLGIRDLATWNKACILKLVWLLFFRENSVWVSWFKEVILRGSISNYWTVKQNSKFSWLANKLIKARDMIFPLIKCRVGNGLTIRFWNDNWSPFGSIYSFLNARSSRLGIPQRATLASLSDNGNWTLPPARTENQIELQAYLTTLVLTEEEDCYEWEIAGRTSNAFSTGEVYTYLRGSIATVNWSHLVWSSFGIPRQSFLTWLVMLDRCPTKDRMISWGLDVSPTCLLCNSQPESRNHMFFDCPFACVIWSAIASRRRLHALQNWEATVFQLMQLTGTKHSKRLTLLCWQSTIYFIWRERNDRLHRAIFRSPELIIRGLDRLIRNRIQSIRVENPRSSSAMMQDWLGSN